MSVGGSYLAFMNTQNCSGSLSAAVWGTQTTTILVAENNNVQAGQIIADAGNTGNGAIGRASVDSMGNLTNGSNVHLHLYFSVYEPLEAPPSTPNAQWINVDPYGVYGYVGSPNCYAPTANTPGYRLFGPSRRNDFDNDARTDFMYVRPGSDGKATWWVLDHLGNDGPGVQFGLNTDIPAPADYDGNGSTDLAYYRQGTGEWVVSLDRGVSSQTTVISSSPGVVPVPGDYDGDGRADFVVYDSGVWRMRLSSTPPTAPPQSFAYGQSTDKPVPADYDGDGKTDIALYRPYESWSGIQGKWYIIYSSTGAELSPTPVYGFSDDIPVPADYDGDGRTDIALYRPFESWSGIQGKWYIIYSSTGAELSPTPVYGFWNDRPVPGDWDNDGRTDIAIFRPSTGTWYALPEPGGDIIRQWGQSTDITP